MLCECMELNCAAAEQNHKYSINSGTLWNECCHLASVCLTHTQPIRRGFPCTRIASRLWEPYTLFSLARYLFCPWLKNVGTNGDKELSFDNKKNKFYKTKKIERENKQFGFVNFLGEMMYEYFSPVRDFTINITEKQRIFCAILDTAQLSLHHQVICQLLTPK